MLGRIFCAVRVPHNTPNKKENTRKGYFLFYVGDTGVSWNTLYCELEKMTPILKKIINSNNANYQVSF
jgi:hypothetical protein